MKLKDIQTSIDNYIQDDVTVAYKYTGSIRNKVFNYNQVMDEVNLDSWDVNDNTCECDTTFKEYYGSTPQTCYHRIFKYHQEQKTKTIITKRTKLQRKT